MAGEVRRAQISKAVLRRVERLTAENKRLQKENAVIHKGNRKLLVDILDTVDAMYADMRRM